MPFHTGLIKAAGSIVGGATGGRAVPQTALPEFITDPAFTRTQRQLEEFGGGVLRGQIPEVAAPLVDPFSPQAEAVLSRALGDVSTGVQESLARSGTARSGLAPAITARAQARLSEDFRFKGLQQALQGRENLLTRALGVTGDVAGRGLQFGEQQNIFNLQRFQLEEAQRLEQEQQRQAGIGGAGELFQQLAPTIGKALPLVGTAIGGFFGGPPGAALGSAIGGAGSQFFQESGTVPGGLGERTARQPSIQPPPFNPNDLSFLQGLPLAA